MIQATLAFSNESNKNCIKHFDAPKPHGTLKVGDGFKPVSEFAQANKKAVEVISQLYFLLAPISLTASYSLTDIGVKICRVWLSLHP